MRASPEQGDSSTFSPLALSRYWGVVIFLSDNSLTALYPSKTKLAQGCVPTPTSSPHQLCEVAPPNRAQRLFQHSHLRPSSSTVASSKRCLECKICLMFLLESASGSDALSETSTTTNRVASNQKSKPTGASGWTWGPICNQRLPANTLSLEAGVRFVFISKMSPCIRVSPPLSKQHRLGRHSLISPPLALCRSRWMTTTLLLP